MNPIFVNPDQVVPKAQLPVSFELFEENLRSSKFVDDNKFIDKLFSTKMCYDVTLEATDGKVRAHKWILKMKSKYFKAMFDHELSDKNQDRFKIRAISCVVLNEILRYIYTEKVQDLGALAHDLLLWSDYFALDDLRDLSAGYVIKSLNPENVLSVIELAVNTNQNYLKEQSTKFLRKNMDKVIASESWLST